ncbi:C2 calcium-dependent domain-containing protein 4C-like [Chiloscyllium punctatum]|uniref:Uncharacterized protein n=1 Tax=Chiloscyllium punctatum TaxID=137246 RepID=A0A401SUN0_CHIPU|nr:hypothetical protein [Chiloscyllium punctatum]
MVSMASYISFKANIGSILPWSNHANAKVVTADKKRRCHSSKDIFSMMVTPDRIPKFFIPPLDIPLPREQGQRAQRGASSPDLLLSDRLQAPERPSSERSCSEPNVARERLQKRPSCGGQAAGDHSDPPTRAAMSLPHLQKITTPYGFPALGEVPHIKRKESLFFEGDVAEVRSSRERSAVLGRRSCVRVSSLAGWEEQRASSSSSSSSSGCWGPAAERSPYPSFMKDKSKFQLLIKKHLNSIKRMKSTRATWRAAL